MQNKIKNTPSDRENKRYMDSEGMEWHRVFGSWKCSNSSCKNLWKSAYTWVLLEKFIDNVTKTLEVNKDYIDQTCKKCSNENNQVLEWKILDSHNPKTCKKCLAGKFCPFTSGLDRPHKEELCAKCLSGNLCKEASLSSYSARFYKGD